MGEKTTKSFTLDVDLHEKAKEEYDNVSGKINDLLEEDLSAVAENKDQELERIENQIDEAVDEVNSLEESLEKEKDRIERLENKKKRIEKKIEKREAEKEAKADFFGSQFEKVKREVNSRDYHGLDSDERVKKFLDEYGSGIWNKFENKVDSDLSRSEFRNEFMEYCIEKLQ